MKHCLVFVLILGFTGAVHASDNSVEVVLEDNPADQQTQVRAFEKYGRKASPQEIDSDADYAQWQYKFKAASDKRLGSAADAAAIKALVPATVPSAIRWVSRSVVVAACGCYLDASSSHRIRCLYVFEKQGRKWKLTHHYRWRAPVF